jgi:hypothetical protein
MWTINLALGYLAAILCMASGVMFNNLIFIVFSLGLALAVFILDKTLEHRLVHLLYYQNLRPIDTEDWD